METTEEAVQNILTHFGKKGMKWGVRNTTTKQAVTIVPNKGLGKKLKTSGGAGHPAHADAIRARTVGQIGKKSGVKALSDHELQSYAKRLQLEASVKRLNYQEKNVAMKFVASILGQSGKSAASSVAGDASSHLVKKHLGRRLVKIGAIAAA